MNYKIIVDSCCDITPEIKKELNAETVPLSIHLGEKEFIDDEALNINKFIDDMNICKEKVGSASPSPMLYQEAFESSKNSFAVTLSSRLSGSWQSAMLGKRLAEESDKECDAHVFDSKSASAGELLIAFKIRELIDEGLEKCDIIKTVEDFISGMKTYFVLDSVDNLMKNGRLNKVKGRIISALNIKPFMGSDGDGNIALFSLVKGQKQFINKLLETIKLSGREIKDERAVITHCNNISVAEKLKNAICEHFNFKEVLIVHTRGVSSLYAADGGIILSF